MTNFMIPKKNTTYLVTKYFKLISWKIISMFFSTVCTCYTSVKYECHTLCLKKNKENNSLRERISQGFDLTKNEFEYTR